MANLQKEVWKALDNCPHYEVSNFGNVKSKERKIPHNYNKGAFQTVRERILRPCINKHGYLSLVLRNDNKGKTHDIHRLVALAFKDKIDGKNHVNHINGIKTDNRADNLEWCTRSENELHAHRTGLKVSLKGEKHKDARLKEADVLDIFYSHEPNQALADKYKIGFEHVRCIKKKIKWKHLLCNL